MEFANPKIFWLLVVIPLLVAYYVWRSMQGGSSIVISSTDSLRKAPRTLRYYLRHLPILIRMAALVMIIFALARPQRVEYNAKTTSEGIDIVIAMDVSTSMLARDFQPDRLTASKEVASQFVANRQYDRIGLVVFAGESYTQSPLTADHASLQTLLGRLRCGVIEDGTAIGNGLATAINRLRESDSKSKIIILLTDGVNNSGQISPLTAADIAKELGLKVYTIGVGSNGMAPYPAIDYWGNVVYQNMQVEIDEKMLREVAEKTGGEYFRATDNESLEQIYDRIDEMEKSKIERFDQIIIHEEYLLYALWALALLLAEFIVKYIALKRIP
jgi:Ca-activated chloride channel family protein